MRDAKLLKAARELVERMADRPDLQRRVSKDIAVVSALTGDIPGGRAAADSLSDNRERASTLAAMAAALLQARKREEARSLFASATRIAQTVEDTFREPTLLHITEAQAVGGDGVGARRTTALLTINYVHLSGLAFAVEGLVRAGDKADAKKLLTETRVQIDSQRDPFTQAICFSHLTKGAKMLGEDVTAKRLAERSVQAANRISNPQNKPDVLRPAAVALAAVGERTRAYDAAAQIGKVKEVPISTFIEVMTLLLIGQVQHRFGDASGAKEAFGRAHQEVNRLSGGELFKAYLEMMYYQSKTGDRDGVRECYRLAREYLKPQNDPGIKLTAEIILAGVLAIAREREEAQAVLKGLEGDPAVIAGIRILRAELDPNPPSPLRPEFIPEIKEA